jgi:hypothetical protein
VPDGEAPVRAYEGRPEGSAAFDASLIQSQSADVTSSTAADAAYNPERDYEVALRRVSVSRVCFLILFCTTASMCLRCTRRWL